MTKKIWRHAKCGCVVWMDDNPKDPNQMIEITFDQSKCLYQPYRFTLGKDGVLQDNQD